MWVSNEGVFGRRCEHDWPDDFSLQDVRKLGGRMGSGKPAHIW